MILYHESHAYKGRKVDQRSGTLGVGSPAQKMTSAWHFSCVLVQLFGRHSYSALNGGEMAAKAMKAKEERNEPGKGCAVTVPASCLGRQPGVYYLENVNSDERAVRHSNCGCRMAYGSVEPMDQGPHRVLQASGAGGTTQVMLQLDLHRHIVVDLNAVFSDESLETQSPRQRMIIKFINGIKNKWYLGLELALVDLVGAHLVGCRLLTAAHIYIYGLHPRPPSWQAEIGTPSKLVLWKNSRTTRVRGRKKIRGSYSLGFVRSPSQDLIITTRSQGVPLLIFRRIIGL